MGLDMQQLINYGDCVINSFIIVNNTFIVRIILRRAVIILLAMFIYRYYILFIEAKF